LFNDIIIQSRETKLTYPSAAYPVPPVRSQISSQDQDPGSSQTLEGSIALRHNKSYPDRWLWTETSESPEFRRFLDLGPQYLFTEGNGGAAVGHTFFFCSFRG